MNRRRIVQLGVSLVLLAGAVFGVRAGWAQLRPREAGIPTTRVLRGEVDTSIHATGELKSTRSSTLMAPAVGGQLRLITMMPTGSAVKAGEIVMAFEASASPVRKRAATIYAFTPVGHAAATTATLAQTGGIGTT